MDGVRGLRVAGSGWGNSRLTPATYIRDPRRTSGQTFQTDILILLFQVISNSVLVISQWLLQLQSHCINLRMMKITRKFHHNLINFFKFQFMSTFAISCNRERKGGERRKSQGRSQRINLWVRTCTLYNNNKIFIQRLYFSVLSALHYFKKV